MNEQSLNEIANELTAEIERTRKENERCKALLLFAQEQGWTVQEFETALDSATYSLRRIKSNK